MTEPSTFPDDSAERGWSVSDSGEPAVPEVVAEPAAEVTVTQTEATVPEVPVAVVADVTESPLSRVLTAQSAAPIAPPSPDVDAACRAYLASLPKGSPLSVKVKDEDEFLTMARLAPRGTVVLFRPELGVRWKYQISNRPQWQERR